MIKDIDMGMFLEINVIEAFVQFILLINIKDNYNNKKCKIFWCTNIVVHIVNILIFLINITNAYGLGSVFIGLIFCGSVFLINILLTIFGKRIFNKKNNQSDIANNNKSLLNVSLITIVIVIFCNVVALVAIPICKKIGGESNIIKYLENKYGYGNYEIIEKKKNTITLV